MAFASWDGCRSSNGVSEGWGFLPEMDAGLRRK
jgi:hypothetical protein